MPRYVDLDKVPQITALLDMEDGLLVSIGDVRKALRLAQVEDVAPVVHAQWIEQENIYEASQYICSNCKSEVVDEYETIRNGEIKYCPCCGAKMDLEDNCEPVHKADTSE